MELFFRHLIPLSILLLSAFGTDAQTTIKISFKQPDFFRVTPDSVSLTLQENKSLELGSEVTISGGLSPYTYAWKKEDNLLCELPLFQANTSGIYQLEVSDKNNCFSSVVYTVSGETSLPVIQDDVFAVFPNPSKGIIHLISSQPKKIRDVSIISTGGKKHPFQQKSADDPLRTTLDVKQLPDGMYFLSIQLDNRTITKTFILKK